MGSKTSSRMASQRRMDSECSGYRVELRSAQVGAMPGRERVGIVEGAEVVDDALLLDEGVLATPLDVRSRQVPGGGAEAAEASRNGESALQAAKVLRVEDESLETDPSPLEPDLHPAVEDAPWRKDIRNISDPEQTLKPLPSQVRRAGRSRSALVCA